MTKKRKGLIGDGGTDAATTGRVSMLSEWLMDRSTIVMLVVPLLALAALFWGVNRPALDHLFVVSCITLIYVMGFQMFMGNSGILAWSYIGFAGIGAFTAAICYMTPETKANFIPVMYPALQAIHMPLPLALLTGVVVAALIAAIVSRPLMRLSGAVCVITHFALLIIINALLVMWGEVTNGPRNFTVGFKSPLGFWSILICSLVIVAVAYLFKESSLGLRLRASRDDRFAAATSGINVVNVRYLSFVISCGIAAFGGGLYALYILDFTGHVFYIHELFVILSMLVIGGSMSVSGSFFGLILVTAMRYGLRQLEPFAKSHGIDMTGTAEIILSILMILFLVWKANGLSGGRELSLDWLLKKEKRDELLKRLRRGADDDLVLE
jgi:branched-chain amino acid transport system permease protein